MPSRTRSRRPQHPADPGRQRRAGAARRRRRRGARRQGRGRARRRQGRLERLSASCTPRRRASGALDIGFVPGAGGLRAHRRWRGTGALDLVFLLGADEIEIAPGAFVVYLGTHGDRGAHRADVILPGAAYPEKSGLYVNTEGRVQMAARAAFPPGDAREDWAILRALSDVLGHKLPYDSLAALAPGAVPGASASAAHRPDRARRRRRHRASWRRAAARPTRRRSSRRSMISISPIRSRAPRRSWRSAR